MWSKVKTLSIVGVSLAGVLATGAAASVLDRVDCSTLLETPAAEKMFDALAADRASLEALESDPPVLVWLAKSAECQGRSQLRVMYRSEARRPAIEEVLATSRFRAFGPVKLTNG
jgi:hypothetical protein